MGGVPLQNGPLPGFQRHPGALAVLPHRPYPNNMGGKRGDYVKRTTVGRDVLGRKVIETEWVPKTKTPWWVWAIVIIVLLIVFDRGCNC